VASAAQTQIKTGIRVNLGWDLNKLEFACFNRQPCELKMVPLLDGVAFDDIYVMNPRQYYYYGFGIVLTFGRAE
jgi:hypothetical protein